MKLIKVLTPALLLGFLAFPAFAAEDPQNPTAQSQQPQEQAANTNPAATQGPSEESNGSASSQHKATKSSCKCSKRVTHHKGKGHRKATHSQQQPSADPAAQGQQQQAQEQPAQN